MNPQDSDSLFSMAATAAFIVGALSYIYNIWKLHNEPDPSTEFGISLNAFLAVAFAGVASLATFLLTLLFGISGAVLSCPLVYLGMRAVIKKMTEKNDLPAH